MRRWMTLAALGCLVWSVLAAGAAAEPGKSRDYLPLTQVQRGMRGVFKTVVEGTRVESFDVEVLGVLPDAGPDGDLIMIRASDAMMERTGGIASGMSGSPVYVDGRLIGALGFGIGMSDHRIGLLTPIETMARLYDLVESDTPHSAPTLSPETEEGESSEAGEGRSPESEEGQGSASSVVPLATPLLASGLSSRAFEQLTAALQPLGLQLRQGLASGLPFGALTGGDAASFDPDGEAVLEPGAAFGIQLVRGDVNLAAIGTVTDVDDQRFIALAHPFTNRGRTAFPASGAYVHHVFKTLISPFKVASPYGSLGAVLQDRGAGVAGRAAVEVPMALVKVRVWDGDRRQDRTFQAEVVQDETMMGPLISAVAFSAADRALDRLGRGTARIVYRVDGEGMPRPLVRTNLSFSEYDVVGAGLFELVDAISVLLNNPFQDVKITEVDVALEVEEERYIALIEEARPLPRRVRPGDTVEVDVTLRPYRQETLQERMTFQVPEDALPGPVGVTVRAGGWAGEPTGDGNEGAYSSGEKITDLESLLERMMEREQNNDLIVEFYPRREYAGYGGGGSGGWHGEMGSNGNDEPRRPWGDPEESFPHHHLPPGAEGEWDMFDPAGRVFETLTTPYVLSGSVGFELIVAEPDAVVDASEAPLLSPL